MIVVTGANGQLGRAVLEALLDRHPAARIAATARHSEAAASLAARGIAIRPADFADPASLDAAFAGADRLLIVSVDKLGEEARRLHRNAIDAARRAGIARILYTSHAGSRPGSPFVPADQHAATETDLAATGLPHAALRHGFYAESCLHMVGEALRAGDLRVPEDGPVAWTARDDLAHADAALLVADPPPADGPTPPLTAAHSLTMRQLADLASETTGRPVRHTTLTDDQWCEEQVASGRPEFYARLLLGMFRAARRGDFAATDPTLASLLGRPPVTMREILTASMS